MHMTNTIHLGNGTYHFPSADIDLEKVKINNENFYKITNVNAIRPFFMSIVSNSNHWMFVASNGGLTAGRKNSDFSLFPYYTDDKITESIESTGCKSIFIISLLMLNAPPHTNNPSSALGLVNVELDADKDIVPSGHGLNGDGVGAVRDLDPDDLPVLVVEDRVSHFAVLAMLSGGDEGLDVDEHVASDCRAQTLGA